MYFYDPKAETEKNMEYAANCAMAISSLEYSQQDDKLLQNKSKYMGGPSDAIQAAKIIYNAITMKNAEQGMKYI